MGSRSPPEAAASGFPSSPQVLLRMHASTSPSEITAITEMILLHIPRPILLLRRGWWQTTFLFTARSCVFDSWSGAKEFMVSPPEYLFDSTSISIQWRDPNKLSEGLFPWQGNGIDGSDLAREGVGEPRGGVRMTSLTSLASISRHGSGGA